ncbi:MAG: RNA methyltransferase [Acidimicrobiia bacterium]|nr:RNA methyltransferase [Acidimicrobiia bacterium]
MEPVSSTRNQHVVRAGRLLRARARREDGATLLEGPHILAEAIAANAEITDVFGLEDDGDARSLAEEAGARWFPVTEQVLRKISDTENPRGPVAIVAIPEAVAADGDRIWLDTSDPGNAGTLIRSAAAFGFGVVVSPDAVDPWSPKVVRSAAGGHFHVPIALGSPGDAFIIATVASGGTPLSDVAGVLPATQPICLLIGNEAHGLPAHVIEAADLCLSIPMVGGIESLNAAVAGAICMYELMQFRGSANHRRDG